MDEELEKLVTNYGQEYLSENDPDSCPYSMDELNELTNYSAIDAITRAFYGYRYNPYDDGDASHREEFNPNDEYFAFNGYGNLVSISSWSLAQWIYSHIDDDDDFKNWCEEQGYVDEEDDEDIDGCKGVGLVSALNAKYDSRASFYGKAQMDDHDDHIALYSYNTLVAQYNKANRVLEVYGYYSPTTARHIREFAKQLGIILPAGKNIVGQWR